MDCVFLTVKVMYKEGEEGRWVGYDIVKQVLDITDTQPFPFFFFFFFQRGWFMGTWCVPVVLSVYIRREQGMVPVLVAKRGEGGEGS